MVKTEENGRNNREERSLTPLSAAISAGRGQEKNISISATSVAARFLDETDVPSATTMTSGEVFLTPGIVSCSFKEDEKKFMPDYSESVVWAGENFLWQTLQTKERFEQPDLINSLLEDPKIKQSIESEGKRNNKIVKIGTRLSLRERSALFSILAFYARTGFRGNMEDGSIRFRPAEFFKLCGVPMFRTSRGNLQFYGAAKEQALLGLSDLLIPMLWYIEEIIQSKRGNKPRYNVDKCVAPIIIEFREEYKDLTTEEAEALEKGLKIQKRPSYFVVKINERVLRGSRIPFAGDFLFKIRQRYPRSPEHFYDFITFLHMQANHTENRQPFKRYYNTLAVNLNLEKYLEKREKKLIKKYLEDDFRKAKKLGYLKDYEIGGSNGNEYVILSLNLNSFYKGQKDHNLNEMKSFKGRATVKEALPLKISKDILNNRSPR